MGTILCRLASLRAILAAAEKTPFQFKRTIAPLRDVERLWNSAEDSRLVFVP